MPTSPIRNIEAILNIILELRPLPARVLDIGIGYGKFGFLCREYLTFWNSPTSARPVVIDGIEAFPDYVGALQRAIYNHIFIGDARTLLPPIPDGAYDLVLLVDVLEHFTTKEGVRILAECRRIGKIVIVSTPQKFWPQGDSWGNMYERHRSLWTKPKLWRAGAVRVLGAENWIAIFAQAAYKYQFGRRFLLTRWVYRWVPARGIIWARKTLVRLHLLRRH